MIRKEDYLKAKETVEKYEEQLRIADVMSSANCYNDLKAWLLIKKNGKRLCDWDDHKHQEIWDKMLELEKKHSEHYA
jgi:hypothetical protein